MTSTDRTITRLPDEVTAHGEVRPIASCSCGAVWEGDGADGLGNSHLPDGTPGISLPDWGDQHVCLDEATRERYRALFGQAIRIREELMPSVSSKADRLCNAASRLATACLYGSPFVLEELAVFERLCTAAEELLALLDAHLPLDDPPRH